MFSGWHDWASWTFYFEFLLFWIWVRPWECEVWHYLSMACEFYSSLESLSVCVKYIHWLSFSVCALGWVRGCSTLDKLFVIDVGWLIFSRYATHHPLFQHNPIIHRWHRNFSSLLFLWFSRSCRHVLCDALVPRMKNIFKHSHNKK